MSILAFVSEMVKPIVSLVDDLTLSREEKEEIKAKVFNVQAQLFVESLKHEQSVLESRSKIIEAEAKGESWLQRNWRPISMLTFLLLIVLDCFGLLVFRLSEAAWELFTLGMTGYVVSRGVEKVAPQIRDIVGSARGPVPENKPVEGLPWKSSQK